MSTPFLNQSRPESVKRIYRALKRDHPSMPAEMKARIAARQGRPGRQKQGPPYKGKLSVRYSRAAQRKDKAMQKAARALTAKARKQVAEGNFALPGRRYPIHDESHARNALARVSQFGTPAEKAAVRSAVARKYPGIGKEKKAMEKLSSRTRTWMKRLGLFGLGAGTGAAAGGVAGARYGHREAESHLYGPEQVRMAYHKGQADVVAQLRRRAQMLSSRGKVTKFRKGMKKTSAKQETAYARLGTPLSIAGMR